MENPLVSWDQALLLLPLPLIYAANLYERPPAQLNAAGVARLRSAVWLLIALVPVLTVVYALLSLGQPPAAWILLVTGLVMGSFLLHSTRAAIARVLPVDADSALDATALVLSALLVGNQLASQASVDVLAQQAATATALGPIDLVLQEIPFLLAAFLGVGLFLRRTPERALVRLGLVRPTAWQVVLALAAAGAFYLFGNGVDLLSHALTPGLAGKVDAANNRLFGQLDNPIGIATIALSAGICEEAFFRGALQPRLGVLWTSLVFAAVHTQYGLSLDAAAVFVLAIGLGVIRRTTNTTTSTICHVAYNALVGVAVAGVLSGAWLISALGFEIALVLAAVAAAFTGRLGKLGTST